MDEKESRETGNIPFNYSVLFYDHPVYSSNFIYGIEKNSSGEPLEESTEARDEPIESWGWVNNADKL